MPITGADGHPSPGAPGSAHLGASDPSGHADPEDAPSVIEGLMHAMVQHRRRMDQQHAAAALSQPGLAPPPAGMHAQPAAPPRPRRSLARHSDVSTVLARSAAVRGEASGGAGGGGPPMENGSGAC